MFRSHSGQTRGRISDPPWSSTRIGRRHTDAGNHGAFGSGCLERKEHAIFYGVVINGSGTFGNGNEAIVLKRLDPVFCPTRVDEFQFELDSGMAVLECYPGNS